MGLPSAVKKQAEEANAIQSELTNDKTEATAQAAKPEPVKNDDQPKKLVTVESLQSEIGKLDERLRSYKKMYDTEVHTFRKTVQEKDSEIDGLKKEIESLKATADTSKKPDQDNDEVLSQIADEFGEEFVDAVSNLSRSQLMRENAKLSARLDDIEKRLTGKPETKQEKTADTEPTGSDFLVKLATFVPEYQTINATRSFKSWLNGIEPDGRRLNDHLLDAQKAGDAWAAAQIFNRYIETNPNRSEKTDGDYLPKGKSPGDVSDGGDEVIHESELKEYYKDKALGKFSPDEIKKIEAKINNAMRKGLIRRDK